MRRALGVNQRHTTTSLFRFVRSELHELTPSHICYALFDGSPAVLLHVLNVKVLERDELVVIDQLARFLMSKVTATIGSAAVGAPARLLAVFLHSIEQYRRGFRLLVYHCPGGIGPRQ